MKIILIIFIVLSTGVYCQEIKDLKPNEKSLFEYVTMARLDTIGWKEDIQQMNSKIPEFAKEYQIEICMTSSNKDSFTKKCECSVFSNAKIDTTLGLIEDNSFLDGEWRTTRGGMVKILDVYSIDCDSIKRETEVIEDYSDIKGKVKFKKKRTRFENEDAVQFHKVKYAESYVMMKDCGWSYSPNPIRRIDDNHMILCHYYYWYETDRDKKFSMTTFINLTILERISE